MQGHDPSQSKMPVPPKSFRDFSQAHPDVARAYDALGDAVRRAGPLNEREVALVKLAISVGARIEGASHAHTRKAIAAGVEPAALRHVAILSAPTIGFPPMMAALGWVEETVREQSEGQGKP